MLYLYIIFFVKNVLMSDVVRRSSGIEEILKKFLLPELHWEKWTEKKKKKIIVVKSNL